MQMLSVHICWLRGTYIRCIGDGSNGKFDKGLSCGSLETLRCAGTQSAISDKWCQVSLGNLQAPIGSHRERTWMMAKRTPRMTAKVRPTVCAGRTVVSMDGHTGNSKPCKSRAHMAWQSDTWHMTHACHEHMARSLALIALDGQRAHSSSMPHKMRGLLDNRGSGPGMTEAGVQAGASPSGQWQSRGRLRH